jgi:type IV fimbrial biogenesis protein FimT
MLIERGYREKGFSLIEVAIVMVIIALVLTFGLPGFAEWSQNTQIRATAESIHGGLQVARTEAVRRNIRIELVLNGVTGTEGVTGWVVREAANNANIIQSKPDNESSSRVTVISTPSNVATVTFDGTGRSPAGTINMTQIDVDSAALSATASRDLRIVISPGGQIRMCDPTVTASGDPRRC